MITRFQCLLILIVISFSSCKKCVTCKNECYRCGSSSELFCSSDYFGKDTWASVKEHRFAIGGCTEIEPTESKKVCDVEIDNLIYLYEKHNYYCDY